ncbi:MAG: NADP-dependent phosphogluconate dehydrogenase [Rudaea sp.]
MEQSYNLGLLGLGVMGRGLASNFQRNGYRIIGYDPAPKLSPDGTVRIARSLDELVCVLETPRVILLMVPAGAPVDRAIASVKPYLAPGDIIVDGGNSNFADTERRMCSLAEDGIHLIGMGISGGENGALWGPSLMPGGSEAAWPRVRGLFESIAARAGDNTPSVAWMGGGGAGHYVKTVHNGIEYADMQLIAEVYDLLHRGADFSNAELAEVFARWNQGELYSYLIKVTSEILARRDQDTGISLVDLIVDEAAQKGTGKWAVQSALDIGAPIPTLTAAVNSRLLSRLKTERAAAAQRLGHRRIFSGDRECLVEAAGQALYAGKVAAYAQGLALLRMASQEYGWGLDLAGVVRVWRAGCIIRAALLDDIAAAFERNPDLPNLLLEEGFAEVISLKEAGWRQAVQTAVEIGIPMPATYAGLGYFDAYRSERLPASLIQAQRDYFGAHTYRRVDRPGVFHTEWKA